MQPILLVLHVLAGIAIVALVLMQHGRGADAGASFGAGASQTMFGSQGSTPFLVKVTMILAAVFFTILPNHSEAVIWIAAVADPMAAFFYLLSFFQNPFLLATQQL